MPALCWLSLLVPTAAWLQGQVFTITPEMYIVGDSTDAGWETAKGLQMIKDPDRHLFRITMRIYNTGYGWKWIRSRSSWDDDCGMLKQSSERYGRLGHGLQGRVEQINEDNMAAVSYTAVYDVVLDMDAGTWSYICSKECEEIDKAFPPEQVYIPLTLLYSGKIRGALLPTDDVSGEVCSLSRAVLPGCSGGIPYIAAYARQLRAKGGPVVLADAGEFFFGGEFYLEDQGAAAAELAQMAGYDALNVNEVDARGGAEVLRNFAAKLGSVPLVSSNAELPPKFKELRPSSDLPYVSNYAVARRGGLIVGLLGLVGQQATIDLPELQVNNIRSDVVATVSQKAEAMQAEVRRREQKVDTTVVLNSLNVDAEDLPVYDTWKDAVGRTWDVTTIRDFLPGVCAIVGGVHSWRGVSVSSLGYGVAVFGWEETWGGKHLMQLDLLLDSFGRLAEYNITAVRMDSSTVRLDSNDAVLVRANALHEAFSTTRLNEVGTAAVPFYFEPDVSAPMMSLMTSVLKATCQGCDVVMLHPSFLEAGLRDGKVTTKDIDRIFPWTGPNATDMVIINVTGAWLLEGMKASFSNGRDFVALRGARVAVYNAKFPYKLAALEVEVNGTFQPVDRRRVYQVCMPWVRLERAKPPEFKELVRQGKAIERNIGSVKTLFQEFLKDHSPLTPEYVGLVVPPRDAVQFKEAMNRKCPSTQNASAAWAAGCSIAKITANNATFKEDKSRLGVCDAGERLDETTLLCKPCPPGTRGVVQEDVANFWSLPFNSTDMNQQPPLNQQPHRCTPCDLGQISGVGKTGCQQCPRDTFSNVLGGTSCRPCPENSTALDPGSARCEAKLGYYWDSVSNTFLSCPPGRTTERFGSPDASWCLCKEGSYDVGDGTCLPCPGGMSCPLGSNALALASKLSTGQYPRLLPQYSSSVDEPFRTYFCESKRHCPGGDPGTCGDLRRGVACQQCEDGFATDGHGTCTSCSRQREPIPIIFTVVGFAALNMVLANLLTRKVSAERSATVTLLIGCCLTVNTFQSLAAFSRLSLVWVEPMVSIKRLLDLVMFKVEVLSLSCLFAGDSTVIMFAISLLIFPALVVWICILAMFLRVCVRGVGFNQLMNSFGSVFMLAYLSLALTSLSPLQCELNPSGAYTMVMNRGIICWDSEVHRGLFVLSVCGIIVYILGFMAMVAWANWVYPSRVASVHAMDFLMRFAFIFGRFRDSCYFCSFLYSIRNFAISLTPVIFMGSPAMQIAGMILVVAWSGLIQCHMFPWRTASANLMDMVFTLGLVLVLSLGAMLADISSMDASEVVQKMLLGVFSCMGIAVLIAFGYVVYSRVLSKRKYGFFLCHHKEGGGSLARFVKLVLGSCTSKEVFLDSDNLRNLDDLTSVVAFHTDNLMVLLTNQTLTRCWCAAEVATAYRYGTNIILITCDDFTGISDEFIESIPAMWSSAQQTALQRAGVSLDMVQEAYRGLKALPSIQLRRRANEEDQQDVIRHAFSACRGGGFLETVHKSWTMSMSSMSSIRSMRPSGHKGHEPPRGDEAIISILVDARNVEALSTGFVLRRRLQSKVKLRIVMLDADVWKALAALSQSTFVVLVLTQGILENAACAALIEASVHSGRIQIQVVPVLATTAFSFPDEAYLTSLEKGHIILPGHPDLAGGSLERVAAAYKTAFEALAARFSPHGSEVVQAAEIDDIATRFAANATSSKWSRVGSLQPSKVSAITTSADRANPCSFVLDGFDCGPDELGPNRTCTDAQFIRVPPVQGGPAP